jgi:hypothetical protein
MSSHPKPLENNSVPDWPAVHEPNLFAQVDQRAQNSGNSLSRHMAVLRRRNRRVGRWHALAIVAGVVLALVMAGVFAR